MMKTALSLFLAPVLGLLLALFIPFLGWMIPILALLGRSPSEET